jgi:hypothetical protein
MSRSPLRTGGRFVIAACLFCNSQKAHSQSVDPSVNDAASPAGAVNPLTNDGQLQDFENKLITTYFKTNGEIDDKASTGNIDDSYFYVVPTLWGFLDASRAVTDSANINPRMFIFAGNMGDNHTQISDPRTPGNSFSGWAGQAPGSYTSDLENLAIAAPISLATAMELKDPRFSAIFTQFPNRMLPVVQGIFSHYYNDLWHQKLPWTSSSPWTEDMSAFGILATGLYQATLDPHYKDVATSVGQLLKDRLQSNGKGGYIWDKGALPIYSKDPSLWGNAEGVPDTYQAGQAIRMAAVMLQAGLSVFTTDDMAKFANTLTEVVWNGLKFAQFTNYIDGNNQGYRNNLAPFSNGRVALGWGVLAQYSAKARDALIYLAYTTYAGVPNADSP